MTLALRVMLGAFLFGVVGTPAAAVVGFFGGLGYGLAMFVVAGGASALSAIAVPIDSGVAP